MFTEDYIMRTIREMIRGILKIVFNIDTDDPTAEIIKNGQQRRTAEELLKLTDDGRIDEAENRLFLAVEEGDTEGLKMALVFYAHLNGKENAFLEAHDFSRREIETGLKDIVARAGFDGLAG